MTVFHLGIASHVLNWKWFQFTTLRSNSMMSSPNKQHMTLLSACCTWEDIWYRSEDLYCKQIDSAEPIRELSAVASSQKSKSAWCDHRCRFRPHRPMKDSWEDDVLQATSNAAAERGAQVWCEPININSASWKQLMRATLWEGKDSGLKDKSPGVSALRHCSKCGCCAASFQAFPLRIRLWP